MFKCECGSPADFWLTPLTTLPEAEQAQLNITRTAFCLNHALEALQDSGAHKSGKVMRLEVSVHRKENKPE